MNPETRNWLASAEYDLDTARQMLKSRRYLYVVFMCHMAIEKALKALVCEETGAAPPRTHDLVRLVRLAKATLTPEMMDFLGKLSDASAATRYPEDLSRVLAMYPKGVAAAHVERADEVIQCLKADPRLRT